MCGEGVLISPQKALEEVLIEFSEPTVGAYPHAVLFGGDVIPGEHAATSRAMVFRGSMRRVVATVGA